MANKITQSISLKISGTSFSAQVAGIVTTTQVGSNYTEETQLITVADAIALDIGSNISEGDLGYLLIRNLGEVDATDATANFVAIATDEPMANKVATIPPGQGILILPPAGTIALWGQSTVNDVQIIFLAVET